jgi:hypothetical protein
LYKLYIFIFQMFFNINIDISYIENLYIYVKGRVKIQNIKLIQVRKKTLFTKKK